MGVGEAGLLKTRFQSKGSSSKFGIDRTNSFKLRTKSWHGKKYKFQ